MNRKEKIEKIQDEIDNLKSDFNALVDTYNFQESFEIALADFKERFENVLVESEGK